MPASLHLEPPKVSLRPHLLTVWQDVWHGQQYDRSGRPVLIRDGRHTLKRTMDGRIQSVYTPSDSERAGFAGILRQRRWLEESERAAVWAKARSQARNALQSWATGTLPVEMEAAPGRMAYANEAGRAEAAQWLESVLALSFEDLDADHRRFAALYKPITILPPDQYGAIVLQLAEGCSYNKCTFCTFYRDRPFRVKPPEEARRHIEDVLDFLGPGRSNRRQVFLGDANALIIPQHTLRRLMELVNEYFEVAPPGLTPGQRAAWDWDHPLGVYGIHSFMDSFGLQWKSRQDLKELADLNLRRVYIGLESGHDPLRQFLGKPGLAAEAAGAVADLKAAGLSVGLILLVGAGGAQYREPHLKDSVALLQAMGLGRDDLVYLSPMVEHQDSPYVEAMARSGLTSLGPAELYEALQEFRQALRDLGPEGPRVAIYDINEFTY